ncbi:MAG: aldehyde ferredoxin oxidoreductase C-terminal domain-containing protein [Candidatus Thorarchaeota archaeon]
MSIDEEEFKIMVDNYYEQRGWDRVSGWPTRTKLEELDLKDVADGLVKT